MKRESWSFQLVYDYYIKAKWAFITYILYTYMHRLVLDVVSIKNMFSNHLFGFNKTKSKRNF